MTTYDIAFDSNQDMFLNGQDIAFANEETIIVQRLSNRLQFLLAEWFLDNTAGLPYIQFIFKQTSDLKDIYSVFRDEINNTEGVEVIDSLELTPDASNKSLAVTFSVNKGTVSDTIEVTV